jgi:anti-sigma factor RsiW
MTGLGDKAEGAALWQRWRVRAGSVSRVDGDDHALLLAAYVDGRLAAANADAVEEWLIDHPAALGDVIAARAMAGSHAPDAPAALLARIEALVAPSEGVVPFVRPARTGGWRTAAAWGGLAASLMVTSLFGFALGSNAYLNVMQQPLSSESPFHELLDPPGQLFSMGDEETAT